MRKNFYKNGHCILYTPRNNWDMNYRLIDQSSQMEYLIDVCDVIDDGEQLSDGESIDDYLLFSDLIGLDDIEYIKSFAWKVEDLKAIEEQALSAAVLYYMR